MNAKKLLFACGMGRKYGKYKLYGYTKKYNQLVQNGNFESSSGWYGLRGTLSVSNNKATITCNDENSAYGIRRFINAKSGSVLLLRAKISTTTTTDDINNTFSIAGPNYTNLESKFGNDFQIKFRLNADMTYFDILVNVAHTQQRIGDIMEFENIQIHNLTQDQNETLTLEQALAYYGTSYLAYTGEKGALMKADLKGAEFSGKNLCEPLFENAVYSSTGVKSATNLYVVMQNWVYLKGGSTITISENNFTDYTLKQIIEFSGDTFVRRTNINQVGSNTITLQATTDRVKVQYYNNGNTMTPPTSQQQIQIEEGNQATTYAPYISPIISQVDVQLGGNHEVDLVSLYSKDTRTGGGTNWTYSIVNGIATLVKSGAFSSGAFMGSGYTPTNIVDNHKYYYFAGNTNANIGMSYYIGAGLYATGIGVVMNGSQIHNETMLFRFMPDLPNGTYTLTPVIVDLTDTFGSGNEPTAQQFYDKYHTEFDKLANGERVSIGWADEWFNWTGLTNRKSGDVDLGTLNFILASNGYFTFNVGNAKLGEINSTYNNSLCSTYQTYSNLDRAVYIDKGINYGYVNGGFDFRIKDTTISIDNPTTFKNGVSGIKFSYELATPTTQNNPSLYLPLGITKCTDKYGHEIEIVGIE